jgi:hypothetical protein
MSTTETRERAPDPGHAYTDAAGHQYLRATDGTWIDSDGRRWTDPSAVRPLRRLEPARPRTAYDEWRAEILDALRIAVASVDYECERERYQAALAALGGSEEEVGRG